jgi:hypothetical protein
MTRPVLAVIMLLAGSVAAFAADCPSTTYDNYIVGGYSCGLATMNLSNFTYSSSSNPSGFEIPAGSVAVGPINSPGIEGMQWSTGWFASTNSGILGQSSVLQYNVDVDPGGVPVTGLSLAIDGTGFLGTGTVVVDETVCLGALLPTCTGGTIVALSVYYGAGGSQFVDTINFTGVTELSISKDVEVQAGSNGQASLSEISDVVQQGGTVPEPGTFVTLGLGFLAVGGRIRHKLKF